MTIVVNTLMRGVQDEAIIQKHLWAGKVLAPQTQLDGCLKKLIENT